MVKLIRLFGQCKLSMLSNKDTEKTVIGNDGEAIRNGDNRKFRCKEAKVRFGKRKVQV